MDFGYMLKTLRIEAGIGLRELARSIDISPSYLSMVENRQQPPPTPARVAQIEQVLNVPKGYLLSLMQGLDPDLMEYVEEVPEVADFLRVAKKKRMKSKDFIQLTGVLNAYGTKGLNLAIKKIDGSADDAKIPSGRGSVGPYLWPYLTGKLIADVTGVKDKVSFLKKAVSLTASEVPGLDAAELLKSLLERERLASTGIGHGIAVPHAYSSDLEGMIVALFRVPEGLDFDSIDEEPAHLVFLLAGPRSDELLHLKLLARIARLFSHNSVYQKILIASSPREIISRCKSAEMGIP